MRSTWLLQLVFLRYPPSRRHHHHEMSESASAYNLRGLSETPSLRTQASERTHTARITPLEEAQQVGEASWLVAKATAQVAREP